MEKEQKSVIPKGVQEGGVAQSKPASDNSVVSIKQATLDKLVDKVDKQSKQISMLIDVADKARLHKFESAHRDMSQKTVKISTLDGKMIIGWKSIRDEMYQDSMGKWHERQEVELYFIDNIKKVVTYMDFTRLVKKVEGLIVSKFTTPDGEKMMRVSVSGKNIDINETFVN